MPGVGSLVVFFVVLALAVAMVFAYLPFQANLGWPWFRASGTAAVFGFVLWLSMNFATAQRLDTTAASAAMRSIETAQSSLENATLNLPK